MTCVAGAATATPPPGGIAAPASGAEILAGAPFADVRTSMGLAMGHNHGAVNVLVGDLDASLPTFPARKDQDVIAYPR